MTVPGLAPTQLSSTSQPQPIHTDPSLDPAVNSSNYAIIVLIITIGVIGITVFTSWNES